MSKTRCYHHIVFSTKYRQKSISFDRRNRLYSYINKIIQNRKSTLIMINGMEEHIHMLVDLHPSEALADLVKTVKQSTSRRISETNFFPLFGGWAPEYYACTVSPSHVEPVKNYIQNQESHHIENEFGKELADFVTKMGLTLYKDEI